MRIAPRAQGLIVVFALTVCSGAVFVWAPPLLSFLFAMAIAIGWCIWLERPPSA